MKIDEFPGSMGEYMLAKSTGEAVCEFLARHFPSIAFYKPRLPRLATDQTASMIPEPMEDSTPLMLRLLRAFRTAATGSRSIDG